MAKDTSQPSFSKKSAPTPPVLTPIKAIRAKCMDCSGDSFKFVKECHIRDCALWPYRMGRRPRPGDENLCWDKAASNA